MFGLSGFCMSDRGCVAVQGGGRRRIQHLFESHLRSKYNRSRILTQNLRMCHKLEANAAFMQEAWGFHSATLQHNKQYVAYVEDAQ